MPGVSDVSGKAANDATLTLTDNAASECLERLIKLAESIDERLELIAEALTATKSVPPRGTKKKSRSRKKQP